FVIVACDVAGPMWQRRAGFLDQLFTRLIEVDFRALGIVGLSVEVEDLFHLRDKFGPDGGEAPLLMLPGFEFVFLSSWRTVSRDSEGASPKATASSASNRNVQRSRPAGAGLQVTAIKWAAPLPVSRGGAPVRGRSVRAPMLSSTKRWRVRS